MSRKKAKTRRHLQKMQLRQERHAAEMTGGPKPSPWTWWRLWFREMRRGSVDLLREGKPRPAPICRDCGATNDPEASECWLCQRRDWRTDPASAAIKPIAGTSDRARVIYSLETILIALALGVVEVGVARLAPGLGVALLSLLVPAWAFTEWKARHREEPMSAPHRFAWMVVTTIMIPIWLVVCLFLPLFILLFLLCSAVLSL